MSDVKIVRCTERELSKSQAFDYLVGFIEGHQQTYLDRYFYPRSDDTKMLTDIFDQVKTIKKGLPL